MKSRFSLLCAWSLLSLAGCTTDTIKPSPTSDQVMAEQYRARGGQGAMSGPETDAIVEAYRQQITRPSQMPPYDGPEYRGGK